MNKICIVTGSRAEYGLLRWVMKGIQQSDNLKLQLIVTGMHLSNEFGSTYQEIEADGFQIDAKIEMLLSSDSPQGIAKSIGLATIGFADALENLKPDWLLLLGDRFELLAAASAALIAGIPIAHIHGGERTEGAFDEAIRHSITKMSYLHFVAAEEYRKRIIQLGEEPHRVFLVGGLGLDNISKLKLLERDVLETVLDIKFGEKNLLITYHPVTLEAGSATYHIEELLAALDKFDDTNLIFTMPNADVQGQVIGKMIKEFVKKRPNAKVYTSLGSLLYLSLIQCVDAVVGNSSSGLIEVPSLKKTTINIGDRQRGRLRASSIIDCEPTQLGIIAAINKAYSQDFKATLNNVKNPYGDGGASDKIVNILGCATSKTYIKKSFHDL